MIKIKIPPFVGSKSFFMNGKPHCALGHVFAAGIEQNHLALDPPGIDDNGYEEDEEYWANDALDILRDFICESGAYDEEAVDKDLRNVMDLIDITDDLDLRQHYLIEFIERYPTALSVNEEV